MTARPSELRVSKDRRTLTLGDDSGDGGAISAELLRIESPSAEVQGHGAGQKTLVAGKRGVTIQSIEPVGNYAVRIGFDDGHSTGIYTWPYLAKLAAEGPAMLVVYEHALAQAGLSRDG
ncbi:MAG: DUF971 domain-containing protein [Alphaproteobacteria bacterium]|nr:DUF971 domain-containing protein [Alphaproteobacteria bacterium]